MKLNLILSAALLSTQPSFADDAQTNVVARRIKAQVVKALMRQNIRSNGVCDIFIEMEHLNNTHASIVSMTTRGNRMLCQQVKQAIRPGTKYRYQIPEKILIIQIDANDV